MPLCIIVYVSGICMSIMCIFCASFADRFYCIICTIYIFIYLTIPLNCLNAETDDSCRRTHRSVFRLDSGQHDGEECNSDEKAAHGPHPAEAVRAQATGGELAPRVGCPFTSSLQNLVAAYVSMQPSLLSLCLGSFLFSFELYSHVRD